MNITVRALLKVFVTIAGCKKDKTERTKYIQGASL